MVGFFRIHSSAIPPSCVRLSRHRLSSRLSFSLIPAIHRLAITRHYPTLIDLRVTCLPWQAMLWLVGGLLRSRRLGLSRCRGAAAFVGVALGSPGLANLASLASLFCLIGLLFRLRACGLLRLLGPGWRGIGGKFDLLTQGITLSGGNLLDSAMQPFEWRDRGGARRGHALCPPSDHP